MSAQEYDRWLSKLRYVKRGDWVLAVDHNAKVGCLRVTRDWLMNICARFNLDPKYVYELDPYLARLRYVRAGDTILSKDHNDVVDALRKLREVLEKIETNVYSEGYQAGYSEGYEYGIAYCLETLVSPKVLMIVGADIQLDVKLEDELPSQAMVGVDVELDTKVNINTEVSITLSS